MTGRPSPDGLAVLPESLLNRVALLEAMVEGAEDGLVVLDERGAVRHLNGIAERLTGLRTAAIAREALERCIPVAEIQMLPDGRTLLVSARPIPDGGGGHVRSEEHTSELQSPCNLVCRLLLEKKKQLDNISSGVVFTPRQSP